MIFRQLFDRDTCTYTYFLADEDTREGVVIDSVRELHSRDAELLEQLDIRPIYAVETHVHADHVTGAALLRERFGTAVAVSAAGGANGDVRLVDRAVLQFGSHRLEARATPGHTSGCTTFVLMDEGRAFTGDALFVRGCGRTDFQEGDAPTLYRSVHEQILSLPDDARLYPGHDYKGRTVTTVAEERAYNPRLGGGKSVEEFAAIMEGLNLAHPARIRESVPANLRCGAAE